MSVSDRALLRGLAKRGEHASFRQHLIVKLQQETKFRALYVVICKLFAEALLRDLEVVTELDRASSEEKYAISSKLTLAAKWAPTPAKAHDGRLLVATAIATILFPDISDTIDRRVTYQKKILTHLRKVLDIPEAKMTAGNWNQINYGRCASKCMAR